MTLKTKNGQLALRDLLDLGGAERADGRGERVRRAGRDTEALLDEEAGRRRLVGQRVAAVLVDRDDDRDDLATVLRSGLVVLDLDSAHVGTGRAEHLTEVDHRGVTRLKREGYLMGLLLGRHRVRLLRVSCGPRQTQLASINDTRQPRDPTTAPTQGSKRLNAGVSGSPASVARELGQLASGLVSTCRSSSHASGDGPH